MFRHFAYAHDQPPLHLRLQRVFLIKPKIKEPWIRVSGKTISCQRYLQALVSEDRSPALLLMAK